MNEKKGQFSQLLSMIISLMLIGYLLSCDIITGPDNSPPKVTITYPINGSTVSEFAIITCVATDNEGIKKVTLWVDGKPIDGVEDWTEPYELIWNTIHLKNGSSHTITVRAIDKSDNKTDSTPIILTVDNSDSYPTKINIEYIQYENNSFIVKWHKSPDYDFQSYRLFEAISENMTDKQEIFNTTNRVDTSYVVQNVTDGEIRYYQLVIVDSIGLETNSLIRKANAKKSTFPTDGLIAYYPFDGNAEDESGNKNHGTVYGATLSFDRFGNPNRAYYFDGQDDYIVINESKTLEPDDFSIVIWMKTKTILTETYQTLLIKEDGWNDGFKIIIRSDRRDNFANTILFTVSGPVDNNNGMVNLHSESAIQDINTWYHIAVTYQAGELMQIFINGKLDITMQGPPGWDKENSYELVIGRHSNNGGTSYGGYFHGVIDDLILYDRVLTTQEIDMLYSFQTP